jgi:[ribosomal protein S5]-alanine N-acetyltransferase
MMALDGSAVELLGETSTRRYLQVPIITARLELRPFRETDVREITQLLGDSEVTRYMGDVKSPAAAAEAVHIMAEAFATRGWGTLAVVPRGKTYCVGYCGVRPLPHTPDVEVAFALQRGCWGQGYATEAASACIDSAFKTLEVPSIVATVYPENARSLRVLGKLGMKEESKVFGYWPMTRALLFRLQRVDWKPR